MQSMKKVLATDRSSRVAAGAPNISCRGSNAKVGEYRMRPSQNHELAGDVVCWNGPRLRQPQRHCCQLLLERSEAGHHFRDLAVNLGYKAGAPSAQSHPRQLPMGASHSVEFTVRSRNGRFPSSGSSCDEDRRWEAGVRYILIERR